MSRVFVVGEEVRVAGFALAGASIVPAEGADAVRRAWQALPADVEVVILTPAAAAALEDAPAPPTRLRLVMPEWT
jgi:vacuolar-type H+-ATPase subunit F/Vma7